MKVNQPVNACVLISKKSIKKALKRTKCADSSGPRGLAIYIEPDTTLDKKEKKVIDPKRIKLLSVFYINGKLIGRKNKNAKFKVIRLDGTECTDNDVPYWEHADGIIMQSRGEQKEIDFKFSFFQYNMLNLILKRWKDFTKKQQLKKFKYFLIGSVQMKLGTSDEKKSASEIYGDTFDLKLEPYLDDKDGEPIASVDLGIPLIAIGFGCRRNWHKNAVTKNAFASVFASSMDSFVDQIEEAFK